MNVIFLISLPRSGSTLLQKILSAHTEVKSVAEPWILLPIIYMTKEKGTLAEYSHKKSSLFIKEFISELPNKQESFDKITSDYIRGLYSAVSQKPYKYFLDKTPRYYNIINELVRLFPDAKFIFLSRNPIEVISSVLVSHNMCDNRLDRLDWFYLDLFFGFNKYCEGLKTVSDSLHIKYDELIVDSETVINQICNFLNLEYENDLAINWRNQNFKGSAGDNVGVVQYHNISDGSRFHWKKNINTFAKKWIVIYALNRMTTENALKMGYDLNELKKTIRKHSVKWNIYINAKDIFYTIIGIIKINIKRNLFK